MAEAGEFEVEEAEEDLRPESYIDRPMFPEPVQVTQKMAEQGRKALEDKFQNSQAHEKAKLIEKIHRYYEFFEGLKETAQKKKWTQKDTLPNLQQELVRCQNTLNTGNVLETIKKLDIFFAYASEIALTTFGVPVQGLTVDAKLGQDIVMQELMEFSIKYDHLFSTGPEFRYLIKYIQRIAIIVKKNKDGSLNRMGTMSDTFSDSTARTLDERYKDL